MQMESLVTSERRKLFDFQHAMLRLFFDEDFELRRGCVWILLSRFHPLYFIGPSPFKPDGEVKESAMTDFPCRKAAVQMRRRRAVLFFNYCLEIDAHLTKTDQGNTNISATVLIAPQPAECTSVRAN